MLKLLLRAAKAIQQAAKNPAVRQAAVRAAKKSGEVFDRFKKGAEQLCRHT